ncbi:MAG: hypothetical protein R3E89_10835 [Thiolinea sp.]
MAEQRAQWGVPLFDNNYRGLPRSAFNLLETADHFSGLLGIARFISTGLEVGETVTLITFDSPENVINKFLKLGYNFQDMINCERLFIMSYKSTFTRSLNISTDYHALFAEINRLSRDRSTRFAFLNADLLFNLESYNLTTVSVSKIHEAAKRVAGTILAQFTSSDDKPHQRLRSVSTSLLDCYLVIRRSANKKMSLEVKTYH